MDGNTLKELAIKVSQYFLDFLESDFKRQQAPRRRIVLQTENGFKAGMRLAPYPALQREVWEALKRDSIEDAIVKIGPGQYSRPITKTLRLIISDQIRALAESPLTIIRHEVISKAATTRTAALDNPERWVELVRLTLCDEIRTQLINPLLVLLDGPLKQQAYSAHDSIFAAESELIELVAAKPNQILPEMLSRYLATGDSNPLSSALEETLALDDVRGALLGYFEHYMAADAFQEFRDLESYATTGEGLQLYLYVGTLKFGPNTYPIFYIPLELKKDGSAYQVIASRHLYTNKRAIDFALQEIGQRQQRQWLSPIKERITYLGMRESIADAAAKLFRDISVALDLGNAVRLEPGPVAQETNTNVSISTALHFAVFERADDAILNDYEEMISQARNDQGAVIGLFEGIVQGVLEENPESIRAVVEQQWEALPIVDRVVIDSPVPLNEEQIKILSAVRQPTGKIIVVEGPPGTGKSHTITAIAADCALSGRSCLILSDKMEALNVVQSKLSDAMNRARLDKNFPNPLLRLGQEQTNFKRLISTQSIEMVTPYVKAAKNKQPQLQSELQAKREELRRNISQTIESYGGIRTSDIASICNQATSLDGLVPGLAARLQDVADKINANIINEAVGSLAILRSYFDYLFSERRDWVPKDLLERIRFDAFITELAEKVDTKSLDLFEAISKEICFELRRVLVEFDRLRRPIIGYLFRSREIAELEAKIARLASPKRPIQLRQDRAAMLNFLRCVDEILSLLPKQQYSGADLPRILARVLTDIPPPGAALALKVVGSIGLAFKGHGVPMKRGLFVGGPETKAIEAWTASITYLAVLLPVQKTFQAVPEFDYVGSMSQIEKMNVTSMNAEVDSRLVNFVNEHKTDARILAQVIANKQKFPESKFGDVKESFPVILASIRQFGEYMPLAPGMFDVVVIDEASQVSVAQAFPALLRAKKIVVLGDSKQFSNTKSVNASNEQNEKHRADLEAFFRRRVSSEAHMLERISKFDVKCSILEFCQLCANYSTMLRKHFRSYQELISYSSKHFYGGQLQAIKIRGVPISEVICFDEVDPSAGKCTRGTNEAEAQFILERIMELLEEECPPTVGVITPFREQQALLTKLLFGHAKGVQFQEKLRLKIMTFDSCQGEERKIIFYSLVATEESDLLNYVFPIDLGDAELAVEEKLKHQRLNVGFSRAEEMIWFVLSKPISKFKGSIAKVLNHYNEILGRKQIEVTQTDPSSPMETKVLDWLQKTPFYQNNTQSIEVLPQFPIGDYLRQLDPTYQHPAWKVDFLLTFATSKGVARIVLEYDGFEHHFQRGAEVNVGNYDRYMLEADVERQLTLESYGYRFLRINRFNLGKDPVATLSDRLKRLVDSLVDEPEVTSVQNIQAEAAALASGRLKTCPKCGQSRKPEDFYDQNLKGGGGGFGRHCKSCKRLGRRQWKRW